MKYLLKNYGDEFNNQLDTGVNLYAGNGLSVEAYKIKKNTRILVANDNMNNPNQEHIATYIVTKGKLEVRGEDKVIQVDAGNSISLFVEENYSCWALENCEFFVAHNCVEPDIDVTPRKLVEMIHEIERVDPYLAGHNYRVGKYSTLIMQLIDPKKSNPAFHMAASYHDVGKNEIPAEIVNKIGKLTDEEFNEIKKHPIASARILEPLLGTEAAEFARWHHEKLDGSGYPDGIKGDEIPMESRVMAVADIFDALTTDRCYRKAFTFQEALAILKKDVDAKKLDERPYEVLKQLIESGAITEGIDNKNNGWV